MGFHQRTKRLMAHASIYACRAISPIMIASSFAITFAPISKPAKSYAALKRRLAEEANGDWAYYTGGKTDFIADILRRALVELDSLPKVTDQETWLM